MKAEELRIGNWVINKASGTPEQVFTLYKPEYITKGCINGYDSNAGIQPDDEDGFEPIPLTEEWLVRFGFEKIRDDNRKQTYQCFDKLLLHDLSGEVMKSDADCDAVMIYHEQYDYLNGHGLRTHIRHVHELQNLYHALTGKELELKQ